VNGAESDLGRQPEPERQQDDRIKRDFWNGIERDQDWLEYFARKAMRT